MKRGFIPGMLALRLPGPWRFGRRWRGHESQLRVVQVIALALLALVGAKLAAGFAVLAVRTIARVLT